MVFTTQDLFSLDLTTLEWSSFKDAGARPPPTSFHTAVQFGQFMITYGGRLNDNSHSDKLNVLGIHCILLVTYLCVCLYVCACMDACVFGSICQTVSQLGP